MIDYQISPHFSYRELTVTQQVGPDGRILANVPGPVEMRYLQKLTTLLLEPIRTGLWCCPIRVNSAFRCTAVEIKVSGKAYGQHMLGQAADIVPLNPDLSIKEAYERIWRSGLPYDQLLWEVSHEVSWIHVSCSPDERVARRQALFTPDTHNWVVYTGQPVGHVA